METRPEGSDKPDLIVGVDFGMTCTGQSFRFSLSFFFPRASLCLDVFNMSEGGVDLRTELKIGLYNNAVPYLP